MELKGKISVFSDNGSTIVRISDTDTDMSKVIASVLASICGADVNAKKVSELEEPKKDNDTPPDVSNATDVTPDFLQNTEDIKENISDTESKKEDKEEKIEDVDITVFAGKYKGKKVSEVLKEKGGKQYLSWLTEHYSGKRQEEMAKIKNYLDNHK